MYYEEIELGKIIEIPPTIIDEQDMLDFAKKYDNIPLHTDQEYCKTTRFGSIIAPGVMAFMAATPVSPINIPAMILSQRSIR